MFAIRTLPWFIVDIQYNDTFSSFYINYGNNPFSEGYLTTCSFDFLTQDQTTRSFNIAIFGYAYALPMFLIVLFYFQLLGHVRQHEKMLKDQVSY